MPLKKVTVKSVALVLTATAAAARNRGMNSFKRELSLQQVVKNDARLKVVHFVCLK